MDPGTGSAGYLIAGHLVTAGGNSGVAWAANPYTAAHEVAAAGRTMIDAYNNLISPGVTLVVGGTSIAIAAHYTAISGANLIFWGGVGLATGGVLMVVLGFSILVFYAKQIEEN